MVELQFLDLKRALYNKGNYRLHVFSGKFAIREDFITTAIKWYK
jgi:hypothetical protein